MNQLRENEHSSERKGTRECGLKERKRRGVASSKDEESWTATRESVAASCHENTAASSGDANVANSDFPFWAVPTWQQLGQVGFLVLVLQPPWSTDAIPLPWNNHLLQSKKNRDC